MEKPQDIPLRSGSVAKVPLPETVQTTVREVFGHAWLRESQEEVLTHVFAGRDTLAILPTGSGKTLCYALPALLRPGLVLVISPLIALIRDQLARFEGQGIPAAALDSLQTAEEKDEVWARIERGEIKILIVSPERLARVDFRERLKAYALQLVAIDEAHCVCQFGDGFRPDYRHLGRYLADLGARRVQKLALTATATRHIRSEIAARLDLDRPAEVIGEPLRENLETKILKASKVHEQMTMILHEVLSSEGSGIVYTVTRKSATEVYRMLRDAKIPVGLYHGGMGAAERATVHGRFRRESRFVVVATHAFGLGIDKSDIRFVHHAGLPSAIEQYVQEIGRAGRDGEPARCSLVHVSRDYHIQKYMIDRSYPELSALRLVHQSAVQALIGPQPTSEDALLLRLEREVAKALGNVAVRDVLDCLTREGVLVRYRAMDPMGGDEAIIEPGPDGLAEELFAEYPLRKENALARLDAMKAYVTMEAEARSFLRDYFLGNA